MRGFSRRQTIKMMATLPLAGAAAVRVAAAGSPRVGGARILVMDERLWIQVRIGREGPFAFVIDTGSDTNLIHSDLARRLRLKERREGIASGIGGTQRFTYYTADDVAFGTVAVGSIAFAGYAAEQLPIHPEAMGALSAAMLTAADADLDFDALEWRIYPAGRGLRAGFERLPSLIRGSALRGSATPVYVDAGIAGATYRLELDTGAPSQVTLFPRATRRSGLWRTAAPYAPSRHAGIGGRGARARLVRLPEVRLGPIAFDRPLVSLSDPDAPAVGLTDGLLGLGLLERLNLSSDIKGAQLWARRNGRPPRPERYGLSGLWVDEERDRLVVADVSPASPAAEAGLRAGDEIPGVALRDWVRRVGGGPGDVVDVSYRRDGKPATTRITLRPFL